MGYFDGLVGVYFKTAQDGGKLYFPWLYWGRGYVIASEQDGDRLRQKLKNYKVITLIVAVMVGVWQNYVAAFIAAALLVGFYAVWTRHLVAGLPTAGEKLSLREAAHSIARGFNAPTLWMLEAAALAFVVVAIFLLTSDASVGPTDLLAIIFFGFGAVWIAYLLILRGRRQPPPS